MPSRRTETPSPESAASKHEPPPSPEAVFRAMNLASKKLPHYFDKSFGMPELRLTEFAVLQQLAESGPTPMVRLSDENLVTKAAITAIVDVMESKGLVRRARDSPDRRVVNVQLTAAGRKLFTVARRRHQQIVSRVVSTLEPDEIRALLRSFEKLLKFIDQAPA